MAENSRIEWTEATWNPVVGCSPVSAGCTHCYAATMARRLAGMGQSKYEGLVERRGGLDVFNGVLRLDEGSLGVPLGWKKPRTVFVNSMSDLFHPSLPFEVVDRVFAVMAVASRHRFQVLTKRPARMAEYLLSGDPKMRVTRVVAGMIAEAFERKYGRECAITAERGALVCEWPLPNVWVGASVESQRWAEPRVEALLRCPAAVRFISAEPLLGPVDLARWMSDLDVSRDQHGNDLGSASGGSDIDWVIVGGESGHHARPMHPTWARTIRDQCAAAGVPFFFKQWGEWAPLPAVAPQAKSPPVVEIDGQRMCRVGTKHAGRLLDGVEHNGFPGSKIPTEV